MLYVEHLHPLRVKYFFFIACMFHKSCYHPYFNMRAVFVCCRYAHMARSVSTSSDDSLSADSYLTVLYVPSFNKPDRSRRSSEDSADSHQATTTQTNGDESPPRSHLDEIRYEECVHYLQEVRHPHIDVLTCFLVIIQSPCKFHANGVLSCF